MDDKKCCKNVTKVDPAAADAAVRTPPVDIVEEADGVMLEFEVPGANSASVSIEVEDHVLSVVADSCLKYGGRNIRFKREFQLTDGADEENITAETKDGVLKVRIPKSERARVHKIKVS